MGHRGLTCGSQPHRTIYGAQWVYLWVSATQADLWGREAPLVGLSPTGRSMGHREAPLVGLSPTGPSMGHSASTCGSQPHRPIYGAQKVYEWVSAPQADLWGRGRPHFWGSAPEDDLWGTEASLVGLSSTGRSMGHSGFTCGSQPHRPIYGAQRGPTCGSQPHRPRWRTGSSGAKPHTCGAELWGGGGSPGRPLQNGVPQHFGGAPRIPPHNPTGAPHHCGEAQPRKIHGDPTASMGRRWGSDPHGPTGTP